MELTSRQKTRRNQVQALVEDDRPFATWIVEHMTAPESERFDQAIATDETAAREAVGGILVRLGHQVAGKYAAVDEPAEDAQPANEPADEDQ